MRPNEELKMDFPLPRPDPLSEPSPAAQGSSFDSSKLTAVTSGSLWLWPALGLAQGVLGGLDWQAWASGPTRTAGGAWPAQAPGLQGHFAHLGCQVSHIVPRVDSEFPDSVGLQFPQLEDGLTLLRGMD